MKRSRVIPLVLMLAVGCIWRPGPASAEMFQIKSKITELNASSGYLKVDRLDPQTDKTEEIKISVDRSAHFDGFESLNDLKVGDEVSIEANYNGFTHDWAAQSIGPYNDK